MTKAAISTLITNITCIYTATVFTFTAMDIFPYIIAADAAGIPDPDGHIPQAYLDVQNTLNRFVEVGYEVAVDAYYQTTQGNIADPTYQKQQIFDLLAANPPLLSVPHYYAYEEDHENYLWYSDFYDKGTVVSRLI